MSTIPSTNFASESYTDGNGCIKSGLRADLMRKSMENKNILKKNSIYVGSGNGKTAVLTPLSSDTGKAIIFDGTNLTFGYPNKANTVSTLATQPALMRAPEEDPELKWKIVSDTGLESLSRQQGEFLFLIYIHLYNAAGEVFKTIQYCDYFKQILSPTHKTISKGQEIPIRYYDEVSGKMQNGFFSCNWVGNERNENHYDIVLKSSVFDDETQAINIDNINTIQIAINYKKIV